MRREPEAEKNARTRVHSAAMVTGGTASLIFGKLFDKIGLPIVLLAFFLGALFAPCVFLGGFGFALAGMILWGVGMGAQDSLIGALLSEVTSPLQFSDHQIGRGRALYEHVCGLKLEGIISKPPVQKCQTGLCSD